MRKLRNSFSFLELLLTIIIMTIVLIPMMQILPQAMRATRKIEQLTQCTLLANEKIEQVRRVVLALNFNFNTTTVNETATAFAAPFNNYKYAVTDNLASGIKNITVVVWLDANNDNTINNYSAAYQEDEPTVQLDTRIANRQ